MKFFHLSDLHLGKRLNEFSLLEDQEYILGEILKLSDTEKPDAFIIAGDVYDKSVPSAEAVQLFDDFLVKLVKRGLEIFLISGNHDSAERVSFASRILVRSGLHISPVYDGTVEKIAFEDSYGKVYIHLLPFLKPANVRRFYPDENITTYTEALQCAISHSDFNPDERNILVTHQFVTGAEKCDSEEISVGGSDNVDSSVFDGFDYVALGHIHGPQSVGRAEVRYSGTPLKYSFSEKNHIKSVTLVEVGEKGNVRIETLPLTPMRDLREIKGTYLEITSHGNESEENLDDYIRVILTDEDDIPNATSLIRIKYPNLMKVDYDNTRTRSLGKDIELGDCENKSPVELFDMLFEMQNGKTMNDEERKHVSELFEKIEEDLK